MYSFPTTKVYTPQKTHKFDSKTPKYWFSAFLPFIFMPIEIKRVRKKGRYFLEQRQNGKVVMSRRWGKNFLKEDAIRVYKRTGTIDPDITRKKRVKVYEIFDSSAKPETSKNLRQKFITVRYKGKIIIHARSQVFRLKETERGLARKELDDNLNALLAHYFYGGEYENSTKTEKKGLKVKARAEYEKKLASGEFKIKTGIVSYQNV